MPRPTLLERGALLLGTFLGTGYAPVASGTVATAAAIPLWLAIVLLPAGELRPAVEIGALAVAILAGVAAASVMERRLGVHDPSEVVIDEVAGFLLTMLFIPPTILTVTAGFFLFRIFDIVKPWPAGPAERLPRGWGIMADDLVCGIYANLILHAALRLLG